MEDKDQEAWNLSQIRQRPSRLNAKPIGSVVRRLMTQSGYGQVQAQQALHEQWSEAVGSTLAKLTKPGILKRGVLLVHAANSATTQELYFQKKDILSKLKKLAPEMNIKDIKSRVDAID